MGMIGQLFFGPIQPFIGNSRLCFIVAGIFAVLLFVGFKVRQRQDIWLREIFPAFPVAAWILYGLWEAEMHRQGANIRIDIFLIVPALYLATFAGLAPWYWHCKGVLNLKSAAGLHRIGDIGFGIIFFMTGIYGFASWASIFYFLIEGHGMIARLIQAWILLKSLVTLTCGVGLLLKKEWARALALILGSVAVAFLLAGLPSTTHRQLIRVLLDLGWNAFIIWYFFRTPVNSRKGTT